jgi:uncharacterized protein
VRIGIAIPDRTGRCDVKINVMNIPEEGLNIQFSKDESWFREIFSEQEKLGCSLNKVEVSAILKRVRETLYLEGDIQTVMEMDCSRCLESARFPIMASFKYVLTPVQKENQEEKELCAEEMDFVYYQDDLIDLDPLVAEQIILQLPMKVLCQEDCKGLCPRCGINRNRDSCQCHKEQIDSRLAVLKKLKV